MAEQVMYVIMNAGTPSHIGHNAQLVYGYRNASEAYIKAEYEHDLGMPTYKVIVMAKLEFDEQGFVVSRNVKRHKGLTVEQVQMVQDMKL